MRAALRNASSVERAAFGTLSSFSATIAAARIVNIIRERRRRFPTLRSLARRAYHAPGAGGIRVHHFLPGIVVSTLSGGVAIFRRDDGRELVLSLPFGVGAGLTADEVALLIELDNPYWRSEKLVAYQGAVAAAGAAMLAARFTVKERRERAAPGRA